MTGVFFCVKIHVIEFDNDEMKWITLDVGDGSTDAMSLDDLS